MLHLRAMEREYLFFSLGNIQHSKFYTRKIDKFRFYNKWKPNKRKGRVKFNLREIKTLCLKQD